MQQLAHYQIKQLIGEGTFASVYRAYDEKFERHVALKILKPIWLGDPKAIERFKREAKTMAGLRHPNIVDVYDVGTVEGNVYLAELLVEGETLASRLECKPLMWSEMLNMLRPLATALDFSHHRDVVHRDIKPTNILLSQDGEVYLSDFGLVTAVEGSTVLTASSGGMIGTPAYMAPEQWEGKQVTAATDVYALSCVIVEMLTGQVLFDGSTPAVVMRQHLIQGPRLPTEWPKGVPKGVVKILHRGLAQDATKRIDSAYELAAALDRLSTLSEPTSLRAEIDEDQSIALEPSPTAPRPSVAVSEPRQTTKDTVRREKSRKRSSTGYAVLVRLTLIILLVTAVVIAILLLLGPVVGNVTSNITPLVR